MEYNTQNPKIKIREYGRNLQKLIDHAATIEDDAERQQVAEGLVNLMNQLSPQSRTLDERLKRQKVWSLFLLIWNLFILSILITK